MKSALLAIAANHTSIDINGVQILNFESPAFARIRHPALLLTCCALNGRFHTALSPEQLLNCLLHVCKQPREQAAAHSWVTEHAEQPYTRVMLAAALKAVDAAIAEEEDDDNSGRDNGIAAGFVVLL
jgi:hypothetical protein